MIGPLAAHHRCACVRLCMCVQVLCELYPGPPVVNAVHLEYNGPFAVAK